MKAKDKIVKQLRSEAGAISRRDLLKHMSLAGSVAALSGVPSAQAADASTALPVKQIPVREAFETLTAAESETLDAFVSRILPSDANGPGAYEARAVHFIDRALAGPLSSQRATYAAGLSALNEYTNATYSRDFHLLAESEQDDVIAALEEGELTDYGGATVQFFNMVRTHTIEGTFSDPYYGGNRGFVGWDMLGYPGVRLGSTEEDVRKGEALEPSRQSAYDMGPYTKDPVREPQAHRTSDVSGGQSYGH